MKRQLVKTGVCRACLSCRNASPPLRLSAGDRGGCGRCDDDRYNWAGQTGPRSGAVPRAGADSDNYLSDGSAVMNRWPTSPYMP